MTTMNPSNDNATITYNNVKRSRRTKNSYSSKNFSLGMGLVLK